MVQHVESLAPAAGEPALVTGLRSPLCYPHPVERVTILETHISWVALAAGYAYKVKKPVNLGFLDFSTLALRRHYCEAELRLNRRTAPALYIDVVPITGTHAAPEVDGEGEPIEYAVRMRRFAQEDLLHERARRAALTPADIDALAACIADFHGRAERVAAGEGEGEELRLALDNLDALVDAGPGLPGATLAALADWTVREHAAVAGLLRERRAAGFVRECHGDLHLANLVMLEGKPVPFDCIEFSDRLRRIDVMSDAGFLVMDLHHHGLAAFAARFLDAYLAATGDYGGLSVLRFFAVYRALVRAKIAAIAARQAPTGGARERNALEDAAAHIRLAAALAARTAPTLTLMHGLSGSGKSTVSQRLVEAQGAIRLRSDVERKRMHGIEALARAGAPPCEGLYSPSNRQQVYARLAALAGGVLAAGYPVIVDAAFLERAQRERFRSLARAAGCTLRIVACEAPEAVLRERVAARAAAGTDASDAGLAVLESQIALRQPPAGEELACTERIDTSR